MDRDVVWRCYAACEGFGEGANEESRSADVSAYAGCFEANGIEPCYLSFYQPCACG